MLAVSQHEVRGGPINEMRISTRVGEIDEVVGSCDRISDWVNDLFKLTEHREASRCRQVVGNDFPFAELFMDSMVETGSTVQEATFEYSTSGGSRINFSKSAKTAAKDLADGAGSHEGESSRFEEHVCRWWVEQFEIAMKQG